MILNRQAKIEKTKKIMDYIVYFSSFIDIAIAILVTLSYFNIGNPKTFLPQVEITLTITVVLTVVLGVLLIYLKHYESLFAGYLQVRDHVNYHISNFQKLAALLSRIKFPRQKYKFKHR